MKIIVVDAVGFDRIIENVSTFNTGGSGELMIYKTGYHGGYEPSLCYAPGQWQRVEIVGHDEPRTDPQAH